MLCIRKGKKKKKQTEHMRRVYLGARERHPPRLAEFWFCPRQAMWPEKTCELLGASGIPREQGCYKVTRTSKPRRLLSEWQESCSALL